MSRKLLLINGHSFTESFCDALLAAYETGAKQADAEVRTLVLRDLVFDPVLRSREQALEPDLLAAQEAILWCDHLVFVYPTWWTNLPALLKGFFDRAFQSGFAFRYREDSPMPEQLLKGRSARLLITMDAPSVWNRFATGRPQTHAMRKGTLFFCGVKPVRVSVFDRVKFSTPERRSKWLAEAETAGKKDAGG